MLCVDAAIHDEGEWKAKQAKIHTQLVELSDGWVYGGTHLAEEGDPKAYAGGHWFRYDPRSHKMEDLGLAMAQEGLICAGGGRASRLPVCDHVSRGLPAAVRPGNPSDAGPGQDLSRRQGQPRVLRAGPGDRIHQPGLFASQPAGRHLYLRCGSESQRIEALPVYRKTKRRYTDLVEKEAPWLYNYWIAGRHRSSRERSLYDGVSIGPFRLAASGQPARAGHPRPWPDGPGYAGGLRTAELSCHGMCMAGDSVLFTVGLGRQGAPANKAEVRLLRYDPGRTRSTSWASSAPGRDSASPAARP